MKRKALAILSTAALVSLLFFFNIYQFRLICSLKNSNEEYQLRLDSVNRDVNFLRQENEKTLSQSGNVSDVSANIVTRLGAKLFEGGVRDVYGSISNYVWMTGEVENVGNVTAFVSLSIRVTTSMDAEIQEEILGTLQPHQVVSVAKTIWPEQGDIVSWSITPLGYHFR
jgi:hypothetical protein